MRALWRRVHGVVFRNRKPQTPNLKPSLNFPRQTSRSDGRTRAAGWSNTGCRTVERGLPEGRTRVAGGSNAPRPDGWAARGVFQDALSRGAGWKSWKRLGRVFPETFSGERCGPESRPRAGVRRGAWRGRYCFWRRAAKRLESMMPAGSMAAPIKKAA
jgi:hypothetical protein